MLTAQEHQVILRETKARRNEAARRRRASGSPPGRPRLRLTLPGVVSWQRPRQQPLRQGGHRTAYPPGYTASREAWRVVVGAQVREAGWKAPPVGEALCVLAEVVAGGKLDLDRVTTAVLDALQAGGALVDDCRVWQLLAQRRRPRADEEAHVKVLLTTAVPQEPAGRS